MSKQTYEAYRHSQGMTVLPADSPHKVPVLAFLGVPIDLEPTATVEVETFTEALAFFSKHAKTCQHIVKGSLRC